MTCPMNSNPSHRLALIGITGTNGKTSCSVFLAQCLSRLGWHCGVIGTLGYGLLQPGRDIGDDSDAGDDLSARLTPSLLTTPDAATGQEILADLVKQGATAAVMEVSSIGMHQHRVKALRFHSAVFTNLSRDHLDYHQSMEDYAECKRQLFLMPGLQRAVVNLDDSYAETIMGSVAAGVETVTYSLRDSAADIYAEGVQLSAHGCRAQINTPLGAVKVDVPLLGEFNLSNLLAVTATLLGLVKQTESVLLAVASALNALRPLPGRMQVIAGDNSNSGITAVVDYAHTPDSLRVALAAMRQHCKGKLHCVFGCGGERDQGKRPLMGQIAERDADFAVVTDDNPRLEPGDDIVAQILEGMKKPAAAVVQRDRGAAIDYAISHAESGDAVLIAGKGHETYQDSGGERRQFSDIDAVREALIRRAEQS